LFQPHLPPALAAIVLCCLEKDPAARYQTADELRNALVAAGANAPLSRPPGVEPYAATLAGPTLPSGVPASVHPSVGVTATTQGHVAATATARGHGAAVTTQGGAAAQIGPPQMAQMAAGTRRSRTALLGGGLLVALCGAGVAAAIIYGGHGGHGGHDDPTGAVAGTSPVAPANERRAATSLPPPAIAEVARDAAPVEDSAAPDSSASPADSVARESSPPAEAPCPPGQTQRDDTHDHCCWPAQAWSISAGKCVGAPSCPDGMIVRGEDCVAPANHMATSRNVTHKPASSRAPNFHLNARSYAPGDAIELRFAAPVNSTPQRRAWITVIEADKPASAYGAWSYLEDGAVVATLKAPAKPGVYEVRLHTDYPARTFNVQRAVSLTVGPERAEAEPGTEPTPVSAQRFTVATTTLPPGATIDVTFATALRALPKERFWITVVEAGAADTTWGAYDYVPAGARHMQITAPAKPGDYEIRLHANYPTKSTNLVHRVAIRVQN
jgi:hypothetical protein